MRLLPYMILALRFRILWATAFLFLLTSSSHANSVAAVRLSDCCFEFTVDNSSISPTPINSVIIKTPTPGVSILPGGSAPTGWTLTYQSSYTVVFETQTNIIRPGQNQGGFLLCFDSPPNSLDVQWQTYFSGQLLNSGTLNLVCRAVCDSLAVVSQTGPCCFDMGVWNRNLALSPINNVVFRIITPGVVWGPGTQAPNSWTYSQPTSSTIEFTGVSAPIPAGSNLNRFIVCPVPINQLPIRIEWTTKFDTTTLCRGSFSVQCQPPPPSCDSVSVAPTTGNCCYQFGLHNLNSQSRPLDGLRLSVLSPGVTITGTPSGPWPATQLTATEVEFSSPGVPLNPGQSIAGFNVCFTGQGSGTIPIELRWQSKSGGVVICEDTIVVQCRLQSQCDELLVQARSSGAVPAESCCYGATLVNNHTPTGNLNGLAITILSSGATFARIPTGPWPVTNATSTSVRFEAASGFLRSGDSLRGFDFCIQTPNGQPQQLRIAWQSLLNRTVVCTDTIVLGMCTPVLAPRCDSLLQTRIQDCRSNFGFANKRQPAGGVDEFSLRLLTPSSSIASGIPALGWTVQSQTAQVIQFKSSSGVVMPGDSKSGFIVTLNPPPSGSILLEWCTSFLGGERCCDTVIISCPPPQSRCDSLFAQKLSDTCEFRYGFVNLHQPSGPVNDFRISVQNPSVSIERVTPPAGWIIDSWTASSVLFRDTAGSIPYQGSISGFDIKYKSSGISSFDIQWCSSLNGQVLCCGSSAVVCGAIQQGCDSLVVQKLSDKCEYRFGFRNKHLPAGTVDQFRISVLHPAVAIDKVLPPAGWIVETRSSTFVLFRDTTGGVPFNVLKAGFDIQFLTGGVSNFDIQWCTLLNGKVICCETQVIDCGFQQSRCDSLHIAPGQIGCSFQIGFANKHIPGTAVNGFRILLLSGGALVDAAPKPGWRIVRQDPSVVVFEDTVGTGVPSGAAADGFRISLNPPATGTQIEFRWCTMLDDSVLCCDNVLVECQDLRTVCDSLHVTSNVGKPCCYEFELFNVHEQSSEVTGLSMAIMTPGVHILEALVETPSGWQASTFGGAVVWRSESTPLTPGTSQAGFKACFDNSAIGYQDFRVLWQSVDSVGIICSDTLLFVCDQVMGQGQVLRIPSVPVLEQHYPSPVVTTTTIPVSIPARMHVRLTVVNALGQEVLMLVNREMTYGVHALHADFSSLPAGTYIIRLAAGGKIASRVVLHTR